MFSNEVLPEFGGGSHCDLFGNASEPITTKCKFEPRVNAFCEEDDCWFDAEGICAANTCYTDEHCGM